MNLVERDIEARRVALHNWTSRLAAETKYGEAKEVVDAVRTVVAELLDDVVRIDSPRARLRRLVTAERTADAFDMIRRQRATVDSHIVQLADRAARDGYRTILQAALALGARFEHLTRLPTPYVALEPMASPVTFVRERPARAPGFLEAGKLAMPFPLVVIPAYADESLTALTIVQHEVGHNLDEDFGITEALRPALEAALRRERRSDDTRAVWGDWCREVVADVLGLVLAGSALIAEMHDWAALLPDMRSEKHPPPRARVRLLRRCQQLLGVKTPAWSASEAAPEDSVGAWRDVDIVADCVLHAPIPSLDGCNLAELAPPQPGQEAMLAAAGSLDPEKLAGVPFRLLPSVARLAAPNHADAGRKILDVVKQKPISDSAPFRFTSFRTAVLSTLTAPILADDESGLKRPPAELFERAQTITLVGASHEGLPALFEGQAKRRLSKRQKVEVCFLSERAIRGLAHPAKDAASLVAARRRVLAVLPALLDRIAKSWVIAENDEAFVFASYWDAEAPGGRIHISAHGWGQNVNVAPAFDFDWPIRAVEPSRTYRFYARSRDELRKRWVRLAESDVR